MKKGTNYTKKKNKNFLNELTKRSNLIKELERKFYQKEEEMCTFTPKINKNINYKLKKNSLSENATPKSQYNENNIPPIFILPATSRIYCFDEENKNVKISELIHSLINKNSTISLENNKSNDFKENSNTLDCIFNYSRKRNFAKNNKNIYSLNNIISNNKKHKFKILEKTKFNSLYKKYLQEENNKNIFEEEKYVPLNRNCFNTFRGKVPKINFKENAIYKTNDLLKIKNSLEYFDYPLYNFMNEIPKTCRNTNTTLNLLEKKSSKKTKINKIYCLNDKMNNIYLNNYLSKNFGNKPNFSNKRKMKKKNDLKKVNSFITNNETKGYSAASNSSAREIQYNKTNSKKDSNGSNMSNFTTFYKSRSICNKRNFNNKNNKKKNNKNVYPRNETYITLQSISDSKLLEMAEYFIKKRDKDDILSDIKYKKKAFYKNNKNKSKNIVFSK